MIRSWPDENKRKSTEKEESWMRALITFPAVSSEEVSDEPIIIEAIMEGYMTDLVGFPGEVVKPLEKMELEVVFGDRGLFRRVMMKFTIIRAPSPYNDTRKEIDDKEGVSAKYLYSQSGTKRNERWRMYIDFKNINSSCPKDYYPLSNIDGKIESVVGSRHKCFLDAYKGYHQVQMAQDDEEKAAFYTDQGTYCYMKMPFGLKNTGATYQRLVDTAFQSQIGRNLKAYVDDMVIKSNDERVLIADITETFDSL
ncbi:reverse transcriptase domain-containing protein [Tanacetum coccineum]